MLVIRGSHSASSNMRVVSGRVRRPIASDPRVLLVAVVLVGLVLRLVDAGARINEDEGYSWLVATAPTPGAFLTRLARFENTPPLFYLLLASLPLTSEVWLRLPSIVAGELAIPVLYAIISPLLGVRAALVAAFGLAVAPFAVSYSDFSRGFMVAGLGILVALLSAQRLVQGGARRWWWGYVLGGAWALYSEYYAGIYLLAIVGVVLVLGRPKRRDVAVLGPTPFLAFVPWIPELVRSMNDGGRTKISVPPSGVSVDRLRDAIVQLIFGEHGVAASTAVRDAQALGVVMLLVIGGVCLRLAASREAFWLLVGMTLAVLALYFAAAVLVTDIWRARYMTTVIPLVVAVLAGAAASVPWRLALPSVCVALAVLGVAIGVTRAGREYEPDTPAAVAIAREHGYRVILTNSSEVAFYGRGSHVILDRPFGMGDGLDQCHHCAVIDDARFGGVRPGIGRTFDVGPIVVRLPGGSG